MCRLQRALATPALVLLVALLCASGVAAQKEPQHVGADAATIDLGVDRVDWRPAVEYQRLTLTITGPEGFVNRQELAAGQSPFFSLFKSNGERLPDGIYRYELRVLPTMSREINGSRAGTVQWGALLVRDGSFVAPSPATSQVASPPASSAASHVGNITRKDSVVPDDLVVTGTACIGPNCVNGDPDSNTLKLKGSQPHILFDDTLGMGCCFPATDWILQANTTEPAPDFFLQEAFSGSIPFSVQQSAPNYTLVVGGFTPFSTPQPRVGIGTRLPLQALHVLSAGTPTLRLEQPVSPGPARTWDVSANDTQFFVSDVTAGTQPFRIRAGAPTSSIDVSASGKVGIGTSSPSQKLHLFGNNGATKAFIEEASGSTSPRELLEIRNNGGSVMIFKDMSVAQRWAGGTFGANFILDEQLHAGVEYVFSNTGNLTIAGTLTQNSDRDTKRDLLPARGDDVLAKLATLPISTWNLKTDDPKVRHLGPMAQDFAAAFGLGEDDRHIAPLDVAGVSLAAIQALKTEKDVEIVQLRNENAQLSERLAALETLVSAMATVKK